MINWKKTPAAIYRTKKDRLKPVLKTDPITLNDLINVEIQKKTLLENTEKFIKGDEISPDTCRFWDIKTLKTLDKDLFHPL